MSYPIEEITNSQYLDLVNKEHDINIKTFLPRCIKFGNNYFVYANSEYGKLISDNLPITEKLTNKENIENFKTFRILIFSSKFIFAYILFNRLRESPKELGFPPVELYKAQEINKEDEKFL